MTANNLPLLVYIKIPPPPKRTHTFGFLLAIYLLTHKQNNPER